MTHTRGNLLLKYQLATGMAVNSSGYGRIYELNPTNIKEMTLYLSIFVNLFGQSSETASQVQ
jgi:hypothetical protein